MTLVPVRPAVVVFRIRLSWPEIGVVRELVKDGADNATIGRRLGKDEQTIKSQMRSTLQKAALSGTSRTALAVAVLRREIIIVDPNSRVVEF